MRVRYSLLAFSFFAFGIAAPVAGQPTGGLPAGYELKGVVVDASRTPIPRAEIIALRGPTVLAQGLTANDGTFTLTVATQGPVSLRVRQLGYDQKILELQIGSGKPAPLDIILTATATELKKVVINVADVSELDEFNQHRREHRGSGKFYDQEEIRKRGAMYPSDLFRTVPGVSVRQGAAGGNAIRIRGCQPIVWMDGQRVPGAELDEVVTSNDIAGIEFYPSMAGTPAKYSERSARPCGTLLVWTKSR
jgi:Carboxypeptidase regulatory-like domain/TonB-dependent Receptor Plug Domain